MEALSLITDMVIVADLNEDEAMARLNAWCAENDEHRQQWFEQLDVDAAGGVKFYTGQVWAMSGNYFPHEKLAEAFPTFGWRYPDSVILIVNDEHFDASRVYRAGSAT